MIKWIASDSGTLVHDGTHRNWNPGVKCDVIFKQLKEKVSNLQRPAEDIDSGRALRMCLIRSRS